VFDAARGLAASQPEALLQRLLAHAQKLLDAPDLEVQSAEGRAGPAEARHGMSFQRGRTLASRPPPLIALPCALAGTLNPLRPPLSTLVPRPQGVIPSLNRLYVSHTELANFFRALGSLLDLPHDAGPGAAVAAIRQLVAAAGR
jgi:hypothetical protein